MTERRERACLTIVVCSHRQGISQGHRRAESEPALFPSVVLLLTKNGRYPLSLLRTRRSNLFRWPRPDEALVTFATPALARQAVSARTNRSTVLLVELLSRTREEKRMGYRRGEEASATACSRSRKVSRGSGNEKNGSSGRVSPVPFAAVCSAPSFALSPPPQRAVLCFLAYFFVLRDYQSVYTGTNELLRISESLCSRARPTWPPPCGRLERLEAHTGCAGHPAAQGEHFRRRTNAQECQFEGRDKRARG